MIDKIMNSNEDWLLFIVNIERQRSGNALSPPPPLCLIENDF